MAERDDTSWFWREAQSLLDEAERIRRQLEAASLAEHGPAWGPPVNVYDAADAVWVVAALPGVAREHVAVRQRGDVLVLEGHRTLREKLPDGRYLHMEIPTGSFERRLRIPLLATCTLRDWKLADGLLWIHFDKRP